MSSRYQDLIHWKTYKNLQRTNLYTGDFDKCNEKKGSYEMLPTNAIIHCQLIDKNGKNIKPNGTFGKQLVWGKICDQQRFYSDILYAIELLVPDNDTIFYTNASLINWPRPNKAPSSYLAGCDKDDSVLSIKPSKYAFVNGTGLNAARKLKKSDSEERFLKECRKDIKNAELVFCDICCEKDIDPNDLCDCDLNLAEIGGGYAHAHCMSEEQMKLYEESLLF